MGQSASGCPPRALPVRVILALVVALWAVRSCTKAIRTGQRLCALPDNLVQAMLVTLTQPVALDAEIEGDVAL